MRQFAGFGSAEDTNARFHYLLEHGQTGLSTAFDLPTLMGRDSDDALARGEVGREGSRSIRSPTWRSSSRDPARSRLHLDDDQRARGGHLRMYLAVAEKQGVPLREARAARCRTTSSRSTSPRRSGSTRRARACGSSPTSWRSAAASVPKWNTISISGYHIREAGSTAVQELAFTLADGIGYVEAGDRRGPRRRRRSRRACPTSSTRTTTSSRRSRRCAPRGGSGRTSCASASARRTRARWMLRFHTQTAGCSLTAQQPLQQRRPRRRSRRSAAVLGGTQSLHTNSLDEALALPTEAGGHDRAAHAADPRRGVRRRRTRSIRWAARTSSRR